MDGGSGGAQHTSAFDRLSDLPTGAVADVCGASGHLTQIKTSLGLASFAMSLRIGESRLTCSIDCWFAAAEMPLSRSLPAGLPQQQQRQPQQQQPQQQPQQSVFARLDGIVSNGVGAQHRASQQQQQQQQHGSVWDRLSGAQPQTAAEANGNVWRRLGPSAGQQQQQQLQRPGSLDGETRWQLLLCFAHLYDTWSVNWQGTWLSR